MTDDALISVEWVKDHIKREIGVDDAEAREKAEHLFKTLHPCLRKPLADWWHTAAFDARVSAQGWTIQRLIDEGVTNCVYGAFTWLDGLLTAPEQTLQLLQTTIHQCSDYFRSSARWLR